ncbi:MAG: Stp1/IreP family PP2C-type Ser/Thr phosphatase [bacterium]
MELKGLTNRGNVRRQNQDAFFCEERDGRAILLVCDGMGGAKAGNVASELAATVFETECRKLLTADTPFAQLGELLPRFVSSANAAVYQLSRSGEALRGMGTTLVGAVVMEDKATVVNVGDSRCYLISGSYIRQITRDHSVVQNMVDRGDITPAQARIHPNKNLITRAVGTLDRVESDIFTVLLKPGDYLLLCSDGLTNELTDEELLAEVNAADTVDGSCQRLLERTLRGPARDNVTAVLFRR